VVCGSRFLRQADAAGKTILFEGAQGTMLDIDHGTYPYVTSSNATSGGACTGSGFPPTRIDKVVGVVKAYTTRVGEGPLPTEFEPALLDAIRTKGNEFGATTGRPRRCGWFDAVVARYAVWINGCDAVAITKLDVLDELGELKICVGYRHQGQVLQDIPADVDAVAASEPVYETMPGWRSDTSRATCFEDLPRAAQAYLRRLEDLMGVPACLISTGSSRSQAFKTAWWHEHMASAKR
jgi:adenylosuccinate synthase